MKVTNSDKRVILADKVSIADNFFKRLIGLIGTHSPEKNSALLIKPCSSIHTCFMKFSIDVIFIDDNGRVLKILHSIKPYHFCFPVRGSSAALELPAGTCRNTDTVEGDKIKIHS